MGGIGEGEEAEHGMENLNDVVLPGVGVFFNLPSPDAH